MADAERSDFSAIRETFTHDELAAYMALQIAGDGGMMLVDKRNLSETHLGPARVAKVERRTHGDYEVTVRERERPTGYYVVYDPNYAADAVLWWDDTDAAWFTTHEKHRAARPGTSITVKQRLWTGVPIKPIDPQEATE